MAEAQAAAGRFTSVEDVVRLGVIGETHPLRFGDAASTARRGSSSTR
jgi:hypothetical protein